MRLFAGLLVFVIAACAPLAPEQPAPQTAAVEKLTPATTREACLAQPGGDWYPICRLQRPACVLTFSDAGKACTDSDQCQGNCYTDPEKGAQQGSPVVGKCAMNSNPCGCNARVEDGAALPVLCVD